MPLGFAYLMIQRRATPVKARAGRPNPKIGSRQVKLKMALTVRNKIRAKDNQ